MDVGDPKTALSALQKLDNYQEKLQHLNTVLETFLSSDAILLEFFNLILNDSSVQVLIRPSLSFLAQNVNQISDKKKVLTTVIDVLKNRHRLSFEEEDGALREILADYYVQAENNVLEAANILVMIKLDQRPKAFQLEKYIRITELFTTHAEEEPEKATTSLIDTIETYCTRAIMVLPDASSESLELRHRICQARLLDMRGKFAEAAVKYLDILSSMTSKKMSLKISNGENSDDPMDGSGASNKNIVGSPTSDESVERNFDFSRMKNSLTPGHVLAVLDSAIASCILAPAGSQRDGLMKQLENEIIELEKSAYTDVFSNPLTGFLQKMIYGGFVSAADANSLSSMLRPCHRRKLFPDGDASNGPAQNSTILDNAISEHNITIASKYYSTIYFETLAKHVIIAGLENPIGKNIENPSAEILSFRKAFMLYTELLCAAMINEDRLSAHLDHHLSSVFFKTADTMASWDADIIDLCGALKAAGC